MLKTLVVKELRESAGIVALAAIGIIYVLGTMTATPMVPWQSSRLYHYPFVSDGLSWFWQVAGALAIALGLRQTAWELSQGNYLFLLHRPVDRSRIFGLKLVIGAGLTMLLSAVLILIYAAWAATPGHFAAPWEWSMSERAWICWIALPPVYIGAFLSGIRPAKWFGTRLVPLLAGIGVAFVASTMHWALAALVISIAGSAFGLISIFYYVRHRDY